MACYPFDLGTFGRPVTTASAEAQRWFDRGLVWTYGFNHEEAVRCFEQAALADPGCAMAQWGIAYATGPNYNKAWAAFDPVERAASVARAHAAVARAEELAATATPVEAALVAALAVRYPSPTPIEDCEPWNEAYATAMRGVLAAHPDDLDVVALACEALLTRTPWALWDTSSGQPAPGADTLEAIALLEAAIAQPGGDAHPGLLHMLVHAVEMSPTPERGLVAADRLRDLVPDAGHLQHMPTHLDVLCGHYRDVVEWNGRAIDADRRYLAERGAEGFYTLYRCHDLHFRIYGALFLGQPEPALAAADELAAGLPAELLRVASPPLADWLEGFVPMRAHVLVRFGRWQELLAEPLPDDPELYCVTTATLRYARGVALAALGDVVGAAEEQRRFAAAWAAVPESRTVFNNTCRDVLAIADAMLAGELAYRQGAHDDAFAHLRRAIALDDGLPYDEPWGWMQPTRHALGALLLEQGRADDAEAVYRADLGLDATLPRPCQHPDNVWSLHGLHECLVRRGATAEAALVGPRLRLAAARATVPVRASCACRRVS